MEEGLTPLLDSPYYLSYIVRRGGIGYIREASPLFDSPYERAWPDGAFERGEAPL